MPRNRASWRPSGEPPRNNPTPKAQTFRRSVGLQLNRPVNTTLAALLGTALDRSRRGSARRVNTPMSEGYPRRLRVGKPSLQQPEDDLPDTLTQPIVGVARRLLDRLNAARVGTGQPTRVAQRRR